MKRYKNEEYRILAERLIEKRTEFSFIKESGIKVAYLACDEEKKKNKRVVFADCTIVDEKYSWCCDYNFFITVYIPNVVGLNDKQKEILMIHELHHIGVDDTKEEPKFYIVPHDVEEFRAVAEEFGYNWEDLR